MSWPITPARFVLTEVDERGLRDGEDAELLSVSISRGVVPRTESGSTQAASEDTSHYKRCAPGQLALNRLRAFQGGIGVSAHLGLVSPDYAVFDIDPSMDPRFVHYQARSSWFVAEMTKRLRGIGDPDTPNVRTPRINVDDVGRISMFTPPLDVQRRVADRLDLEMERIDRLITKNTLVQEQLEIRWSRLVEDAVADHPLVPLQYVTTCNESSLSDEQDPTSIIYYIDIGAVGQGRYVEEPERMSFGNAPSRARRLVRSGDTLVSTVRTYLKAVVMVPEEFDGHVASTGFAVLTPGPQVYPKYLAIACAAESFAHRVAARSRGVSYPAINASELLQLGVSLPCLDGQRKIVDRLAVVWRRHQSLHETVARQSAALERRRRSLITAAVAGQIDV